LVAASLAANVKNEVRNKNQSNKVSTTSNVEEGKNSSTKATPTKKKNVNRVSLDEEGKF